jgi:hypothetical protein
MRLLLGGAWVEKTVLPMIFDNTSTFKLILNMNATKIPLFRDETREIESLSADYESWTARQKQDFLWENRILKSRYDRLPPLEKIDVIGLFITALATKMDRLADEAPRKWKKAIHARGSVAKIAFIPTDDTPFTGLFAGADCGLLRLSVTGDPSARGFAPGLALKLFIDGKPSENFSALVSLTGQGDNYNFFAHEFSNIVPTVNQIGPRLINLIFRRVSKYPTKLFLADMSEFDQRGQIVKEPCYPSQVFLVPNPSVQFPETPGRDFREDLATIPSGTRLFSVYGVDPSEVSDEEMGKPEYRQKAKLLGYIQTNSEFISSSYGDIRLFFRHQRFRDK